MNKNLLGRFMTIRRTDRTEQNRCTGSFTLLQQNCSRDEQTVLNRSNRNSLPWLTSHNHCHQQLLSYIGLVLKYLFQTLLDTKSGGRAVCEGCSRLSKRRPCGYSELAPTIENLAPSGVLAYVNCQPECQSPDQMVSRGTSSSQTPVCS